MLVTHTSPSFEDLSKASSQKVTLQQYASIIGSVLQLPTIKNYYEQKLKDRSIFDGYQSQPALELTETEDVKIADSFDRLLGFLEEDTGAAVATVLGSYGT